MSKHPLDRQSGASKSRLEKFTEVEKASLPSAATKTLQRRPRTNDGESRAKAFSRIERTGSAG